jgi:hypothetical protein
MPDNPLGRLIQAEISGFMIGYLPECYPEIGQRLAQEQSHVAG